MGKTEFSKKMETLSFSKIRKTEFPENGKKNEFSKKLETLSFLEKRISRKREKTNFRKNENTEFFENSENRIIKKYEKTNLKVAFVCFCQVYIIEFRPETELLKKMKIPNFQKKTKKN